MFFFGVIACQLAEVPVGQKLSLVPEKIKKMKKSEKRLSPGKIEKNEKRDSIIAISEFT